MILVSDTSPLNYLVLIGCEHVLPLLYGQVVVPPAVIAEMCDKAAPQAVSSWAARPPRWLHVPHQTPKSIELPSGLDAGEREAIAAALASHSKLLIDEKRGREVAVQLGLEVTGTLGILREAHRRGLIDFRTAVLRLRSTSFRISDAVLQTFYDDL